MPRGWMLFAWVLLPIPATAADKPADPPWKTNTPIVTVKKELHRKHSRRVLTALQGASDGSETPSFNSDTLECR